MSGVWARAREFWGDGKRQTESIYCPDNAAFDLNVDRKGCLFLGLPIDRKAMPVCC